MDSNATNPEQNEDLKQVIDNSVDPLIGVSEELELVVSTKIGNLSKVVDDIEKLEQTAYDGMKKIVKDKEASMLNVLENKFQEYQTLLEKKKDELKNNITSHFRHLGESVLVRHNPSDQQYEAKGKIVEWKNTVKKKMDKWSAVKNMDVANEIIEEDETAVGPEINIWANKIENLLTAENKEILVDKSFLVFDEDFPKAIASLCEYRVINEESLFAKIMKGDSDRNQVARRDSEKERFAERNQLFETIFKAYSFSADFSTQGFDTIKLTPTTSFFSPDKSKIKSEVEKLANISSFKVQCTDFKTKTLPNFSQALLLFSNLKELHITLEFCEKLTDYSLELLGSCYASFPQLQSLNLNLQSDCSKVSAFGFHCLIENICSLQKLSQLSLNLGSFPNIIETAFSDSIYTLRDLPNLKDLKLGFPTLPTISDNGITRLSSLLERSNDLCSLDLSLSVDSKLTDKGFIRLCDSISLHRGLTNLKINLKDKVSGVTGQGFSCFVKTVSKLQVLNTLSIGLPEAHITNEEFTKFANVLAQSACLKSVSVNFAWTHVNDIGLFDFGAVMGSLVYLEDLSLNFKACSISNEGFCEVAKGVTKLFNLNRLELDMSWCKDITDKGLEYFGEEVQKMKGFSRLLLRFEESKKITEAGMVKLCGRLAGLDTLANLQIHLVKCGRDLVEDRSKDKMEQALVSKRRHFIKNIWIVE